MKKTIVALSLAPAFFAGALALAQEPIAVYVTAATDVPKIDPADRKTVRKDLEVKARAAYDAMKAAEKEIKAQHGKKKEAWPKEKQEAFQELEDDRAEAEAALAYLDISPKGLSDSVQDIRESLAGKGTAGVKEYAKVVDSPDLADIVVEVVGRRSAKSDPGLLRDNEYYVAMKISAGPRFDAARLGKIPSNIHWRRLRAA